MHNKLHITATLHTSLELSGKELSGEYQNLYNIIRTCSPVMPFVQVH